MNTTQLEYMTLVNRYFGHVSAADVWLFVICLVVLIAGGIWCGMKEDRPQKPRRSRRH